MEKLPVRKNTRLSGYDYSRAGYYFITICIKDRRNLLGDIVVGDAPLRVPFSAPARVPFSAPLRVLPNVPAPVPQCILSEYGIFVDVQIKKIGAVYPHVYVDKYVIMPNHIHMIIIVEDEGIRARGGASPTKAVIPQIVQSLKSMTARHFGANIWQRSYYDHIIRNEADYKHI